MNKNIKLCGIGNGLVDLQFEVDDYIIDKLKLNKGEMRLVSSEEQQIMIQFIRGQVLGVREQGLGVQNPKPKTQNPNTETQNLKLKTQNFSQSSGGSAANTIIAFAEFGGSAAYMTSLGNDDFGKYYSGEFKELGIKLDSHFLETEPTGTCLVLITPDSERTMNTALGASALFSPEHINEETIAESEWLYLEGYKLTAESSTEALFEAIRLAKKSDTKIAFTFSDVFVVENFRENLEKVVKSSDLIFCNKNEAKAFTQENDFDKAKQKLFNKSLNVIITMGSDGSFVKWEDNVYNIPSYPVKAIDSTGAGDMFAGGFLYGIIYKKDPVYAGNLGSYAASLVVSQMGARLKTDYDIIKDNIINYLRY